MRKCGLALGLVLVSSTANAQVVEGFSSVRPRTPIVYVIPEHGAEVKGRLLRSDPESIAIWIDGRRIVFQRSDVRRVYRRGDSLMNGMAIGGITGLIASVVVVARTTMPGCETFRGGGEFSCNAAGKFLLLTITAPLFVGAGMGAGAGIDALFTRRTLIYERPSGGSLSFAPMIGPKQQGMVLALRW